MLKRVVTLAVFALWLGSPAYAHSQRMTEMYIPIGQSPGVSAKLSVIGEVESVDRKARTFVVTSAAGAKTVRVGDQTRIWLDRSQLKLTNEKGSLADVQKGRRVEVRFATADNAQWVKVQAMASEAGAPAKPQ